MIRNRYQIASDCRIPIERHRGRAVARPEFDFGECVHYTPLKSQQPKRDTMMDGIYLGCVKLGGCAVMGTPQGVVQCRSMTARPEGQRWSAAEAAAIIGTPWALKGEDGAAPPLRVDMPEVSTEEVPSPPETEFAHRALKLERWMFEQHGWTQGCGGCNATRAGRKSHGIPHVEACRKWIESDLCKTDRGRKLVEGAKARTGGGEDAEDQRADMKGRRVQL